MTAEEEKFAMFGSIRLDPGELGDPRPLIFADTSNAGLCFGPVELSAPAVELRAWLIGALTGLNEQTAGHHAALVEAAKPRTTQRLADDLIPGDMLVVGDERWEIDRVERGRPTTDQVTVEFVGRPQEVVLTASTMCRVEWNPGDDGPSFDGSQPVLDECEAGGAHTWGWHAEDGSGRPITPGVYCDECGARGSEEQDRDAYQARVRSLRAGMVPS